MNEDRTWDVAEEPGLHAAIADYLLAIDAGATPDREAWIAQHPEFADELRAFFTAHDQAEAVARQCRVAAVGPAPKRGNWGKYEILREIARGGMGIVYQARDRELGRLVALKLLARSGDDEPALQRFRLEAEAIAALQHPNIVRLYEYGTIDDQPFIAMDFVDGENLATKARVEGLAAPRQSAEYVRVAAEAVHYAHERGILHRDLKPSNVLIDERDQLRLTDFGLAKRIDAAEDALTRSGAVLGTPSYMPPEQARGDRAALGPASDVYALGAILYELLVGRPPFLSDSTLHTLMEVLHREPAAPRALNPQAPRDLDTICLKCLEKDPAKRYPTARALAEELGRFLAGAPIQARPTGRGERLARWARRNPLLAGLLVIAVALTVLLVLVAGTYADQQRRQARTLAEANARLEESRREADRNADSARAERDHAEAVASLAETRDALSAWRVSQLPEMRRLLDRQVPRPDARDYRGWEWRFLDCLAKRDATIVGMIGASVDAVAWSPDGKRLASGDGNGAIRVWSPDVGQSVEWTRRGAAVLALAWHPSLPLLAVGRADRTIDVFDAEHGILKRQWRRHRAGVRSLAWSPGGEWLVSGDDGGSILVWNERMGEYDRALDAHGDRVAALAFAPDGGSLVSASWDKTLRCIAWDTGRTRWSARWPAQLGMAEDVAWRPDGRSIAVATWGGHIALSDPETGDARLIFGDSTRGAVQAIDFHPNGEWLAAIGYDRIARVYDVSLGREMLAFRGHEDWGLDVAWRPDGNVLASAGKDGQIRLWNPGEEAFGPAILHGGSAIFAAVWNPRGDVLAVSDRDVLRLLMRHERREWKVAGGFLHSVAWSPNGEQVALAIGDGSVLVVRASDFHIERSFPKVSTQLMVSVAFDRSGERLAAASSDGGFFVWRWRTGDILFQNKKGWLSRIASRPQDLQHPELAFSPVEETLAVIDGRAVCLWDSRGNPIARLEHAATVTGLAWRPRGDELATTATDGVTRVWSIADRAPTIEFRGHANRAECVAWSPDGERLASGGWDKTVRVWHLPLRQMSLTLDAHSSWVQCVSWSADGLRIASGGWDATVRLWDASVDAGRDAAPPPTAHLTKPSH